MIISSLVEFAPLWPRHLGLAILEVDAVSEDQSKSLALAPERLAEGCPAAHLDPLLTFNFLSGRRTGDLFVFAVDFQLSSRLVTLGPEVAVDGGVRGRLHIDDMSTSIVAACTEVLAVRGNIEEELVFEALVLMQH